MKWILSLLGLCGLALALWFFTRTSARRATAAAPALSSAQERPLLQDALSASISDEERSAVAGEDAPWVLFVIDPSRRLVRDAEVVRDGLVLAVSGIDGRARVARSFQDPSGALTVDVRAEGYVTEAIELRSDATTEQEVVLDSSMDLCGRVVCQGDRAPVAGVLLVALEVGRPWSRGLISRLTEGGARGGSESPGFTSESDVDGSFCFDDLPAGVRYEILALGDGLSSPKGFQLSHADGRDMEIEVARLCGVAVDFVVDDGSGGKARDPRIDFSPSSWGFVFRGPRPGPYGEPRAAEGFHGIPVCSEGAADLVLVFTRGCEVTEESWLELPIDFQGYAPTKAVLPLREVRKDGWILDEVALQPTAERWGQVQVRFTGVPPAALARMPEEDRDAGTVRLKDPEGRYLVRRVAAKELAAGIEFELPAGDYELEFEASESSFVTWGNPAHLRELLVAEGSTATTTIDLSACGSAELHVTCPTGMPYAGRLVVDVLTKDTSTFVAWVQPPYVISLVPKGDYEVRPYLPGLVGRDLHAFEVRRGELTHVTLEGIVGEVVFPTGR